MLPLQQTGPTSTTWEKFFPKVEEYVNLKLVCGELLDAARFFCYDVHKYNWETFAATPSTQAVSWGGDDQAKAVRENLANLGLVLEAMSSDIELGD